MVDLCKHLSQIRSMFFSPAFFYWVHRKTQEEIPLERQTRTILGLRDGFSKAYTEKGGKIKIKKELTRQNLSYGNPQRIDECYLPPEAEHVIVRFSLQVAAYTQELHTCCDPATRQALEIFAKTCTEVGVYQELARRYLLNIFMGRWLWLNQRTLSTEISLTDLSDDQTYTLSNVQKRRRTKDLTGFEEIYKSLTDCFALALTDRFEYWDILVEAKIRYRPYAEIFPSLVFSEKDKNRGREYATFCLGEKEQIIFTSYKIGAAVHMVDDWFPGADSWKRVSAFGSDREQVTAHRHPDTNYDVYSIMQQADELTELMRSGKKIPDDTMGKIYYLAAMLVCGGMRQIGEES